MSDILREARGVSHCHHCFKRLQTAKGGGYHFMLVVTPDGHEVRVHGECQQYAIGDGYTLPAGPGGLKGG